MPNFIKLNHHIRRKKFCTHLMQIFSKCSDLSANFLQSFDKFCNWFINYCDSSCEHVIELSILWNLVATLRPRLRWAHLLIPHFPSLHTPCLSFSLFHTPSHHSFSLFSQPIVSLFPSFTPLLIPHFPSLTLFSTLFSACFKLEAFKNLHLIFQKRRSDIQGIQTWKLQNGN